MVHFLSFLKKNYAIFKVFIVYWEIQVFYGFFFHRRDRKYLCALRIFTQITGICYDEVWDKVLSGCILTVRVTCYILKCTNTKQHIICINNFLQLMTMNYNTTDL